MDLAGSLRLPPLPCTVARQLQMWHGRKKKKKRNKASNVCKNAAYRFNHTCTWFPAARLSTGCFPIWSHFISRLLEMSHSYENPSRQSSLNSLAISKDSFSTETQLALFDLSSKRHNKPFFLWSPKHPFEKAIKSSLLSNVLHHLPQPITRGVCHQPLLHL